MITCYDVIVTLLRTEKGSFMEAEGKYAFHVNPKANKLEIKKAVEEIYKVKVKTVNTISVPAKPRRVRQELGKTTPWKKAIVSLKEGEKIDIT